MAKALRAPRKNVCPFSLGRSVPASCHWKTTFGFCDGWIMGGGARVIGGQGSIGC